MILWNYHLYDIEILSTFKKNPFFYWCIKIGDDVFWVIRRVYIDSRVFIANEMKTFFNLEKLSIITTKYRGKFYVLIRSFDPTITPEITLREYSKTKELLTDDIYDQAVKILSFRRLMCMDNLDDSSIVVRREGLTIKLYSLLDTFNKDGKPDIPLVTFRKWFDPIKITLTEATQILLRTSFPRDTSQREIDRFSDDVEPMLNRLKYIVNHYDTNLVWYVSDVSHYLIARSSPSVM